MLALQAVVIELSFARSEVYDRDEMFKSSKGSQGRESESKRRGRQRATDSQKEFFETSET